MSLISSRSEYFNLVKIGDGLTVAADLTVTIRFSPLLT